MSGVPIGMLLFSLIAIIPLYKILTASYAPLKIRIWWLVLALGCIAIALIMSYLQILELQSATTDVERLRAMMGMGGLSNFIGIFGPLAVFLLLKPFIKKKYRDK